MIIQEGKAKIYYKEEWLKNLSKRLEVFYNPNMKINRDFTLLVLDSFDRKFKILDSMAGTGIRSIRMLKEIPNKVEKVYIVDKSKKAIEWIKKNLELNNIEKGYEIINEDCRKIMLDEKFDYIDIDPFGSPVGFIQLASLSLRNKGILGVTATDISALSGSRPKACFKKYSCIGIKTDFYLEFGIRVLIKYIIEEGLKFDVALIPVFGYYYLHHYRVFFIKSKKSKDRNYLMENIKFIYYCKDCHYKTDKEINICPICKSKMIRLGPIYTGKIYDKDLLEKMIKKIDQYHEETKKVFKTIYENDFKTNIWYYYDLRYLAKNQKIDKIPKIRDIINKFNCFRTHFSNLGIKCKEYPKLK